MVKDSDNEKSKGPQVKPIANLEVWSQLQKVKDLGLWTPESATNFLWNTLYQ